MIYHKLYLDKTFYLFLLIIIFCGLFNNFIIYFLLLVIHELGHTITGIILGEKFDKIKIYPYGGVTMFKPHYNISLKKELLILINGPLLQIIGYFLLKKFISYDYLKIYHYTLLIFNLLPIYPLDGGRIINVLFNYQFNYQRSFKITYIMSLILIIIGFIFSIYLKNYNFTLIMFIISLDLIKCIKNIKYIYNNFLLERLLHNYQFKKIKCIHSYNDFYRDNKHIIGIENEDNYLKKHFH